MSLGTHSPFGIKKEKAWKSYRFSTTFLSLYYNFTSTDNPQLNVDFYPISHFRNELKYHNGSIFKSFFHNPLITCTPWYKLWYYIQKLQIILINNAIQIDLWTLNLLIITHLRYTYSQRSLVLFLSRNLVLMCTDILLFKSQSSD